MMEKTSKLSNLKKSYLKIKEKYELPDFDELNKDFQIERIAEFETDYLVREIRKVMADKLANYLRFIEMIVNPVNVPIFVFSIVKSMRVEDKRNLSEVYQKLTKIEIDLIEADVEFSEERDVKFIKQFYKIWQEIKQDILVFLKSVKENIGNNVESKEKGYFG